jgi:hypothetical protein
VAGRVEEDPDVVLWLGGGQGGSQCDGIGDRGSIAKLMVEDEAYPPVR